MLQSNILKGPSITGNKMQADLWTIETLLLNLETTNSAFELSTQCNAEKKE